MVSNYTGSGAHCYANGPRMSLLAARAEAQAEQQPELGFAFAYSPECVEGELSEVRGGTLSSLCLSAPCACSTSLTPGWRELIG
jgi:hypothetical protein